VSPLYSYLNNMEEIYKEIDYSTKTIDEELEEDESELQQTLGFSHLAASSVSSKIPSFQDNPFITVSSSTAPSSPSSFANLGPSSVGSSAVPSTVLEHSQTITNFDNRISASPVQAFRTVPIQMQHGTPRPQYKDMREETEEKRKKTQIPQEISVPKPVVPEVGPRKRIRVEEPEEERPQEPLTFSIPMSSEVVTAPTIQPLSLDVSLTPATATAILLRQAESYDKYANLLSIIHGMQISEVVKFATVLQSFGSQLPVGLVNDQQVYDEKLAIMSHSSLKSMVLGSIEADKIVLIPQVLLKYLFLYYPNAMSVQVIHTKTGDAAAYFVGECCLYVMFDEQYSSLMSLANHDVRGIYDAFISYGRWSEQQCKRLGDILSNMLRAQFVIKPCSDGNYQTMAFLFNFIHCTIDRGLINVRLRPNTVSGPSAKNIPNSYRTHELVLGAIKVIRSKHICKDVKIWNVSQIAYYILYEGMNLDLVAKWSFDWALPTSAKPKESDAIAKISDKQLIVQVARIQAANRLYRSDMMTILPEMDYVIDVNFLVGSRRRQAYLASLYDGGANYLSNQGRPMLPDNWYSGVVDSKLPAFIDLGITGGSGFKTFSPALELIKQADSCPSICIQIPILAAGDALEMGKWINSKCPSFVSFQVKESDQEHSPYIDIFMFKQSVDYVPNCIGVSQVQSMVKDNAVVFPTQLVAIMMWRSLLIRRAEEIYMFRVFSGKHNLHSGSPVPVKIMRKELVTETPVLDTL